MPNAFDRFVAEKTKWPAAPINEMAAYDQNVPWRQEPAVAIQQGAISPTQAYQMQQQRYAQDALAGRAQRMSSASLPNQSSNLPVYIDKAAEIVGTHPSVMRSSTGFGAWEDGLRGGASKVLGVGKNVLRGIPTAVLENEMLQRMGINLADDPNYNPFEI